MTGKTKPSMPRPPLGAPQPTFRSGAVARLVGMPVSTLRVWEQRYQAVGPTTAASGHRLYSSADVERVALLRQLTGLGHAIGSLAGLTIEQLQDVALAHVSAEPNASAEVPRRSAPMRIVVVGHAMARRLKRPAVLRRCTRPPQVVGVFDSLADATQARAGAEGAPIDLLLWQAAGLQTSALPELKAAQAAWNPRSLAVVYRFAGSVARDALAGTGAIVVRDPPDDDALGSWLCSLESALLEGAHERNQLACSVSLDAGSLGLLGLTDEALPVRRFDDDTLTAFAGLSSSIGCECPSHVAELLMQIASFEAYSADCAHRSPADAELHAYLQRVAGSARVLFESALERVAIAEGWAVT
ncbi:MAG: helix-turn-helix-type transcriptional regulator [Comamonadaceae bacterium]|nr:helix-turn-helix-type transcriptional regulator [Comamonadaceae bacterium]